MLCIARTSVSSWAKRGPCFSRNPPAPLILPKSFSFHSNCSCICRFPVPSEAYSYSYLQSHYYSTSTSTSTSASTSTSTPSTSTSTSHLHPSASSSSSSSPSSPPFLRESNQTHQTTSVSLPLPSILTNVDELVELDESYQQRQRLQQEQEHEEEQEQAKAKWWRPESSSYQDFVRMKLDREMNMEIHRISAQEKKFPRGEERKGGESIESDIPYPPPSHRSPLSFDLDPFHERDLDSVSLTSFRSQLTDLMFPPTLVHEKLSLLQLSHHISSLDLLNQVYEYVIQRYGGEWEWEIQREQPRKGKGKGTGRVKGKEAGTGARGSWLTMEDYATMIEVKGKWLEKGRKRELTAKETKSIEWQLIDLFEFMHHHSSRLMSRDEEKIRSLQFPATELLSSSSFSCSLPLSSHTPDSLLDDWFYNSRLVRPSVYMITVPLLISHGIFVPVHELSLNWFRYHSFLPTQLARFFLHTHGRMKRIDLSLKLLQRAQQYDEWADKKKRSPFGGGGQRQSEGEGAAATAAEAERANEVLSSSSSSSSSVSGVPQVQFNASCCKELIISLAKCLGAIDISVSQFALYLTSLDHLLNYCDSHSIELDLSHYNAIIRLYYDSQLYMYVLNTYQQMVDRNVLRDRETFTYLILSCGNLKRWQQVIEFIRQADEGMGFITTTQNNKYTRMIGRGRSSEMEESRKGKGKESWNNEVVSGGVSNIVPLRDEKEKQYLLETILQACASCGQLEFAERFMQLMQKNHERNVVNNPPVFKVSNQLSFTDTRLSRDHELHPSPVLSLRMLEIMIQLAHSLHQPYRVFHYSSMFFSLFHSCSLTDHHLPPPPYQVMTIVLDTYIQMKQLDYAIELWKQMKAERKIDPYGQCRIYMQLIDAIQKEGELQTHTNHDPHSSSPSPSHSHSLPGVTDPRIVELLSDCLSSSSPLAASTSSCVGIFSVRPKVNTFIPHSTFYVQKSWILLLTRMSVPEAQACMRLFYSIMRIKANQQVKLPKIFDSFPSPRDVIYVHTGEGPYIDHGVSQVVTEMNKILTEDENERERGHALQLQHINHAQHMQLQPQANYVDTNSITSSSISNSSLVNPHSHGRSELELASMFSTPIPPHLLELRSSSPHWSENLSPYATVVPTNPKQSVILSSVVKEFDLCVAVHPLTPSLLVISPFQPIRLLLEPQLDTLAVLLRAIGVDAICMRQQQQPQTESVSSSSDSSPSSPSLSTSIISADEPSNRIIVFASRSAVPSPPSPVPPPHIHLFYPPHELANQFAQICRHFHLQVRNNWFYSRCQQCQQQQFTPITKEKIKLLWNTKHRQTQDPEQVAQEEQSELLELLNREGDDWLALEAALCRNCGFVRYWHDQEEKEKLLQDYQTLRSQPMQRNPTQHSTAY